VPKNKKKNFFFTAPFYWNFRFATSVPNILIFWRPLPNAKECGRNTHAGGPVANSAITMHCQQ